MILLALDLDGTLITRAFPLTDKMKEVLECAQRDGCILLFVTGRTTKWAYDAVSRISVPFFLAPYNGACTIAFPGHIVKRKHVLDREQIMPIFSYMQQYGSVIYECGGQERVFATQFPKELQNHLDMRKKIQQETWHEISSYDELPQIQIACVRFFVSQDKASDIQFLIESETQLLAPTMVDSFDNQYTIVQVTALCASKGEAVKEFRQENRDLRIIAFGNDMNDIAMLREADIGIATPDAPLPLRELANIIAPGTGPDLVEPIERIVKQEQEKIRR